MTETERAELIEAIINDIMFLTHSDSDASASTPDTR